MPGYEDYMRDLEAIERDLGIIPPAKKQPAKRPAFSGYDPSLANDLKASLGRKPQAARKVDDIDREIQRELAREDAIVHVPSDEVILQVAYIQLPIGSSYGSLTYSVFGNGSIHISGRDPMETRAGIPLLESVISSLQQALPRAARWGDPNETAEPVIEISLDKKIFSLNTDYAVTPTEKNAVRRIAHPLSLLNMAIARPTSVGLVVAYGTEMIAVYDLLHKLMQDR